MLRFVAALSLVAVLASSEMEPLPRYHPHGMEVSRFDISIEVPQADRRDPEKCEIYENVDYMTQGCEQFCSIEGSFGNVHVQDAHPRKVSTCLSAGTFCRIPMVQHSEVNVTFTNGRCNEECRCVPANDHDDAVQTIRTLAGALLTSRHHHKTQHRVHSGLNQFGVITIRIPVSEDRNQTSCEDYESSYMSYGKPKEWDCLQVCSFNGYLGNLAFDGKPRFLAQPLPDGSSCELRVHDHGKISLKGVEQVISGQCFKGLCRPEGWKEEETVNTSTPVSEDPVIVVTSDVFRDENEISSEEDSDPQDRSSE